MASMSGTQPVIDWLARASRLITLAVLLGWLAYTVVSWALVWDREMPARITTPHGV